MTTDMSHLVQASARGDRRAFGEIVERYQGAVCAMAYSVTGDFPQSEDLAQETFVIAWQKLGNLRRQESLGAWLCGIARNLARNWQRRQAKALTVPLGEATGAVQPGVDSEPESRSRQERSEAVWAALAGIPETYREPLVLFYRQERSIRAIAEALDLSEDCVKQRLSRGRNMLRAEVARMVEETLEESQPGKAFTAGVIAALPPLSPATPTVAATKSGAGKLPAAKAPAAALAKLLGVALVAVLVLGGLWKSRQLLEHESEAVPPAPRTQHAADVQRILPTPEVSTPPSHAPQMTPAFSADAQTDSAGAAPLGDAAVSGIAVFVDNGKPAAGMRVLLATEESVQHTTVTDSEGWFAFKDLAAGECAMWAYDDRYGEIPEDWQTSDHLSVQLSKGDDRDGIRLAVPPYGGRLTGRVHDKHTGKPWPDITVEVIRWGRPSLQGKSDEDGQYRVLGLPDGEWLVRIDRANPVFSSSSVDTMHTIIVISEGTTTLDIPIDPGIPIHGQVVNPNGEPVADAIVEADLFVARRGNGKDCYFRSNGEGRFTVSGASEDDRAVLSARKGDQESHIAVVTLVAGKAPENVLLTLQPTVNVSGHFVDERGRPVKANFWRRSIHPDGPGKWSGVSGEPAVNFEVALAQGEYEVKGRPKDNNFGIEDAVQGLRVGPNPVTDLRIKVATLSELAGAYTLDGTVVDETGQPLRRTRVYIDGASRDNMGSFQETHTDEAGRFSFEGLLDDRYGVHATPSEPFESFPGFDAINPTATPEVTIVARLAAKLCGRVLDADTGEPINSFRAEYGAVKPFGRESRWEEKTIASETGSFVLPARLEEDWYLRISADGYGEAMETGPALASGESTPEIEFRLSPVGAVTGIVTDSDGAPVAHALVYDSSKVFEAPLQSARHAAAETDSDGRFNLRSLPEDTPTLYVRKEGYAVARAPVADDMHVVLTQGGTIEGRVLIGDIPPPAGSRVFALLPGVRLLGSGTTDETGNYAIAELMDAAYQVVVDVGGDAGHRPSQYALRDTVQAVDETTVTCDITVPLGSGVVTGMITHDGVPVPNVPLKCSWGGFEMYTNTDETGQYRIDSLPAGSVRVSTVTVSNDGSRTLIEKLPFEVEVQADAEVRHDFDLTGLE